MMIGDEAEMRIRICWQVDGVADGVFRIAKEIK